MEKTKILQVIGGLNRGGSETMIMNVLRTINKEKFQFDFLVFDNVNTHYDYEDEVLMMGCKVHRIPAPKFYNPLKFIKDLGRIINKEKYDCVHSHTLFNSGFVCLASKIAGVKKIVSHSHSTGVMNKETVIYKMYKIVSKMLIQTFSDKYLACGKAAGVFLFGKKKFNRKGIIIKNSVDLDMFNCLLDNSSLSLRTELNMQDNEIHIGCVGSFYQVKNHVFLLDICEYALNLNINNFHFYFVGKGYLEDVLRKEVETRGLEQFFSFLGTRSDVNKLMKCFDVLVMPSLYEGLPVTLIEAQATGLYCVISDAITKEVDLGLSLVKFISLTDKMAWINALKDMSHGKAKFNDMNMIEQQFKINGYFLEDSVKILEGIYTDGK